MLNFLKNIFGETDDKKSAPSQQSTVQVPESVLDRFLLNCQEFYYKKPEADKLIFVMKGNNASISQDEPLFAGISIMSLTWLRNVYKSNKNLFFSIIEKYAGNLSVSDDDMQQFLWTYFRTGNSAKHTQLLAFYKRGHGIIKFMDSLLPYSQMVFDDQSSSDIVSYVNSTFGKTSSISNVARITDEDFAKIIIRDMHSGDLAEKQNTVHPIAATEDLTEVKHVHPKMPRQQKQQKGQRLNSVVSSNEDAYLLLFSASWCGPSKKFVKEIKEAGINSYTYIDVDEDWTEDLATKYNVRSIPMTFLVKTNGDVIKKWTGYDDEDPGQTKFVSYINTCGYNIIPFTGNSL